MSVRINSGKGYPRLFELFLPNNKIFSKSKLIGIKRPILNHYNLTLDNADLLENNLISNSIKNKNGTAIPNKIILIAPKTYGSYPNAVWRDFYLHLSKKSWEVLWISPEEDFNQNRATVQNQILNFLENSPNSNLIFFDPLASTEVFKIYRDLDQSFFRNLRNESDFQLIGLLGDIWRDKDRIKIIEAEPYFDGFIHLDNKSAFSYPKEVKEKFFFFPFVAFDSGIHKPADKKDGIVFSGQIRDSDRRYWLFQLLSLCKSNELKLSLCTWYKWNPSKIWDENRYSKILNSSLACFSLSQKGKYHWLITARALQAILSGCLLIHQEGYDFNTFENILTPNTDYLPFRDEKDLKKNLELIKHDPILARNIAENGRRKIRELFPEELFWKFCLNTNH